jgi:hypothetical protein
MLLHALFRLFLDEDYVVIEMDRNNVSIEVARVL